MSQIHIIESIYERKGNNISSEEIEAIEELIFALDKGDIAVVEKNEIGNDKWVVNQWVKKAIILYFKIKRNEYIDHNECGKWFDKVANKFSNYSRSDFEDLATRIVPPAYVRYGSYIGKNTVIMPSFINIGSYIDDGSMIDSWVTIGSCARVGKKCHIAEGVCLGGVLEPIQANPVIVEDNCFIGAGSKILEGVIVGEGSVIAAGNFISSSTKIIDRVTGKINYKTIPPYSVVIPGSIATEIANSNAKVSLSCAVIVKQVDAQTREKTAINEILRNI